MKTVLFLFFIKGWVLATVAIAGHPIKPLQQVGGFPPDFADALADYGVTTDRHFVVAAASNGRGVAKILDVSPARVEQLIRYVAHAAGRDWIEPWVVACRQLVEKGAPDLGFMRTPLLAVPEIPVDKVRSLVAEYGIVSVEGFYASAMISPEDLKTKLQVDAFTFGRYLAEIRKFAPHIVAPVDRSQARGELGWNFKRLLDR